MSKDWESICGDPSIKARAKDMAGQYREALVGSVPDQEPARFRVFGYTYCAPMGELIPLWVAYYWQIHSAISLAYDIASEVAVTRGIVETPADTPFAQSAT